MDKENFCQTLDLTNTHIFSKITSPLKLLLLDSEDTTNIENIIYFLYQQENSSQSYQDWFHALLEIVPTYNKSRSYYSKWSKNKLLNYIALKKHVKITVINQQQCSKSKSGYHQTHSDKKCFISVCTFNSYITCLNSVYQQYTFITKKGRFGGIFHLKCPPFFKILYSTSKPTPLKNIEDTLSQKYNVPHFSLLVNFLPDPLSSELDPLQTVQVNVRVFVPDSLFDGSPENLHCIGNLPSIINFFIYSKPITISANWGTDGGETINTVLIFTLQEGVHCLYDVPIQKPNLAIELPLKVNPIEKDLLFKAGARHQHNDEEVCPCHYLQDYYIPSAKHKMFKPVGCSEEKDVLTLLQISGFFTQDMEKLFLLASKISVMSFDVESLGVNETNISIKNVGIATRNDNTYLEGKNLIQRQIPFLIGVTHYDLDKVFRLFSHRQFKTHYKCFINGTMDEHLIIKSMEDHEIPQKYGTKVLNILLSKKKTTVFHIDSNENPSHVSEPTPSNIETMVTKFIRYAYIYAKKAKLVKLLLFHSLNASLNQLKTKLSTVCEMNYSDLWEKIDAKMKKVVNELFLIAFNASGYDAPLLEPYIWNISMQVGIKTTFFKKATLINSINLRIPCWMKESKCLIFLTFKDVKHLQEPNVSLATLGKIYNLEVEKGLFPHALSLSIENLKNTLQLPPYEADAWFNVLTNSKPSRQAVEQAHQDFSESSSNNLYQYCVKYLHLDCEVLFQSFMCMLEDWNRAGVNLILAR